MPGYKKFVPVTDTPVIGSPARFFTDTAYLNCAEEVVTESRNNVKM